MQDTAYLLGTLALSLYADGSSCSIAEIGLRPSDTSLRDRIPATTKYEVVDRDSFGAVQGGGEGDLNEAAFDFVASTIHLERDADFWCTFIDLCRKTRDGGYIYVNTFPNGDDAIPRNIWRFCSGSGLALAKWAASQGQNVSLVESFFVDSEGDTAPHFVGVFRKGRLARELPKTFLFENVPCSNVITWKSPAILKPIDDMERMRTLQKDVSRLTVELAGRNQELRDRQHAIEQIKKLLAGAREERDYAIARLADVEQSNDPLRAEMKELEGCLIELAGQRRAADQFAKEVQGQLATATEKLATVESGRNKAERLADVTRAKLDDRFGEIATLTNILREEEASHVMTRGQLDWLRDLATSLRSQPKWWSLMPSEWRARRESEWLKRRGLFDGAAYLRRHPDVAEAGFEPLHHYVQHGLQEGRSRS